MEILKRAIESYREIGNECVSIKVENDCIVPDVKPDVAEIVLATSSITEINARPYTDRVVLSGQVAYRVIYGSEEGGYDSMCVPADFTTTIWVQGATSDSTCLVKGATAGTECRIINSRKVNIKTSVELCVEIIGSETLNVSTKTQGQEEMELATESVDVLEHGGNFHFTRDLAWTMEVPQGGDIIQKILFFDISPRALETSLDYDRIMVSDVMELWVLYSGGEDSQLQVLTKQVAFDAQGDKRGITPGSNIRISTSLRSPYVQILNDQDGEPTVVEIGVSLSFDGVVGEVEKIEYIRDGYSRRQPLVARRSDIDCISGLWLTKEKMVFTEELVMPDSQIGEVIGVWAHTDNLAVTSVDDEFSITGNGIFKVLYTEQGTKTLMGSCFTVPISVTGELPGGSQICNVSGIVSNLSWNLQSPLRIGVKYEVTFELSSCTRGNMCQVESFEPNPAGYPNNFSCGMLVYYPQKGETPWDVASKYMVSVNELRELNGIDGDSLPDRIFLPGRSNATM